MFLCPKWIWTPAWSEVPEKTSGKALALLRPRGYLPNLVSAVTPQFVREGLCSASYALAVLTLASGPAMLVLSLVGIHIPAVDWAAHAPPM